MAVNSAEPRVHCSRDMLCDFVLLGNSKGIAWIVIGPCELILVFLIVNRIT